MKYFKEKLFYIVLLLIVLLLFILIFYNKKDVKSNNEEIVLIETTTIKNIKDNIYVDVKGNVKNPGVYSFKENDRVKDAIERAGGLTKSANTNNINLSQKLYNEMVIYVYSNNDIKKNKKILDCNTVCETNVIEINNCVENSNNLVNINTATLDELLTIPGIGESKAKSIIEYRNKTKFNSIEDIKNVSGIGESLFESIKDKITV